MAKQKVVLEFSKSTKGTHVYCENDPSPTVPTLYIKRDKLPANPPACIEMSLTWSDE